MQPSYQIPEAPVSVEHVVKKSIFICHIIHATDREKCQEFISAIRAEHSNANHNCWAFIAGSPTDPANWGMNDDGEPKGCAGKPMFNVLQHSGIGEICTVVTRYFGGIKLGTGGMARAYSGAVKQGLDALSTITKKHYIRFSLNIGYEQHKDIEHLLGKHHGKVIDISYNEQISLILDLPPEQEEDFRIHLNHLGKGSLELRRHTS